MKIISVHVQDFGKLHDVKLPLNDGINVIKNSNGFGKTTMASFIRAMLYGFTYRSSGGVKDHTRFAPWQNTRRFGGSMVVSHDGQTYRIERFFGTSKAQEMLTVTNDKTGKALDIGDVQPGEYFLGLTADSYDRSAYFPQEAVSLASNDNFDSKLANLVENSSDDYDKIQNKLREYKKSLRHATGRGGKICELEDRLGALHQQQREQERAKNRAAEIEKVLQEIAEEKQELLNIQQQHKRTQAELQREIAVSQPSPEQQRNAARLAELNNALSRIPPEFDSDVKACEALAKQIDNTELHKQQKKKGVKTMLYCGIAAAAVGIVALVLGFVTTLGVIGYSVGSIALVLGAIGIAGHFILTYAGKSQHSAVVVSRDGLIANYMGIARKYVYVDGVEYEAVKQSLWKMHSDYLGDVRERDALQNTLIEPSTNSTKAEDELNQLNQSLSDIETRLNGISMQIGELTTERKNLVFDSVAIEDELLNVTAEMAQAQTDYEVADTVSRLLAEAKDNLSSGYLPKLTARCSQLLSQITQGSYSVEADRNFNLKIREQGQTHDMQDFSRGIREITLLCFRVALSELLYDGTIPFIIIDDAFVNFDEDNFVRATSLLKQLSKTTQVVYFTCHNRTGELLK